MSVCDNLLQAQAITSNSRLSDVHGAVCGKTIHIGFFFDGFARHRENDLDDNKVSNIGRLFMAHTQADEDTALDVYRRVYLSGLGADYDASLGVQARGSAGRTRSEVQDIPSDVAGNQVIQGVKDSLAGRSWWQRLQRDLGELRNKPSKALKVFKDTAINTAAESSAPVRDSRWSAHYLKTGVDTRLQGALQELDAVITKETGGSIPLITIKISVFGYDFGATLARAFIHSIFESCQQQQGSYVYRQVRVEVVFAGLFDAVDRTSAELPPLEFFLPTTNVLSDGGLIHPETNAVLHLVAAHERRFYRRARLLGDRRRNWREELMPGVSEDIGGGMASGEQKPSNELMLASLHRMYRAAVAAGAALPSLADLERKDPETAELFVFNDRSPSQYSAQSLTIRYQRTVGRQPPSQDAFTLHMRYYIRWLANIWHAYKAELRNLGDQEDRLQERQFANSSGISRLLGQSNETTHQRQLRLDRTQIIKDRREALHAELSWLEDVDAEARDMISRLRVYGSRAAGTPQQLQVWRALLSEWIEPSPLEPEIADLFAFFVHDQQVLSNRQRGMRWLSGENFFAIRCFDRPSGRLAP
tara:strand:- start:3907 stop:5670 length:1764 start_codon:yes stop_codon:yes gene_type:complete